MSQDEANPEEQAGFLNRWSARKKKNNVDTETAPSVIEMDAVDPELSPRMDVDIDSDPVNAPVAVDEEVSETDADVPVLTDEDMPAITTLTAQSDLSDFFNKGVSAALRRAALRHVFSLPVYNVRDGLNDYDDDYTKFEPLGDTVTSDMKWHKARKERLAEEEAERKRLAEEEAAENEDAEQLAESDEASDELESVEETDTEESIESDDSGDVLHADANDSLSESETAEINDADRLKEQETPA